MSENIFAGLFRTLRAYNHVAPRSHIDPVQVNGNALRRMQEAMKVHIDDVPSYVRKAERTTTWSPPQTTV